MLVNLSIILQPFSWSCLPVTEAALLKILAHLKVFVPFLRALQTFGNKLDDRERAKNLTYYHNHPSRGYGMSIYSPGIKAVLMPDGL